MFVCHVQLLFVTLSGSQYQVQSGYITTTDVGSARVLLVLVSYKGLCSYLLVSKIAMKGLRSYPLVLVEVPWL